MDRTTALALLGFIIATGVTMGLYQINFQGFTHLTNYSKTPAYSLAGTQLLENGTLILHITRVAGPDTYGGFIVLVQVLYPNGTIAYEWNSTYLGHIPPQYDIINEYDLPGHLVHSDGFASWYHWASLPLLSYTHQQHSAQAPTLSEFTMLTGNTRRTELSSRYT